MRTRFLLALLLFLLPSPAMAANLYMSSCSHVAWDTGCEDNASIGHADCATAGTLDTNPVCPDGNGNGIREVYGWFQDGAGLEAGAGDTIYLCAGACDGSGTEMSVLQEKSIDGHSGGWTVTSYPGEWVTLDGGSTTGLDGTGQHFAINNVYSDITWDGFGLSHFRSNFFYLDTAGDNITIRNMELSYLGFLQTDIGVGDTGGDCGAGTPESIYAVYMQDVGNNVSTFTFENNVVHHICKFALRCNNLESATAINYLNNEFYNMASVTNDFSCRGLRIIGNTIWDGGNGISSERRTIDAVISDNTIECRGTYTQEGGECRQAISIDDTDTGGGPIYGAVANVTIERNRIWSSMPNETDDGNLTSAIKIRAGCQDGTCTANVCVNGPYYGQACTAAADCACQPGDEIVIQNNFIWNVRPTNAPPFDCGAGSCANGAIAIATYGNAANIGAIIRNNTIYRSNGMMQLSAFATPGTGAAVHQVYNNLLLDPIDSSEAATVGVWVYSRAGSSVFTDNNIRANPSSGNAVEYVSAADFACAGIGGWGTGNICAPSVLENTSGSIATWDLHLDATDTNNIDVADCSAGPAADIDSGARGAVCEIGADERGAGVGSNSTLEGATLTGGTVQ